MQGQESKIGGPARSRCLREPPAFKSEAGGDNEAAKNEAGWLVRPFVGSPNIFF